MLRRRNFLGFRLDLRAFTNTIGRKLTIGFTVVLLITAIVGAIGLVGMASIRTTLQNAVDTDFFIQTLTAQAAIEMLEARRAEKDYMLNFDTLGLAEARAQYVDGGVFIHTENLRMLLSEISTIEGQLDHPEDVGTLESLLTAVGDYESGFMTAIEYIELKGIMDEGLIGTFRDTAQSLESAISSIGDPESEILLLQMRQREKDYLLHPDSQHATEVRDLVAAIQTRTREPDLDSTQAREIRDLARTYQIDFDSVVAIDFGITGQIQTYSDMIQTSEPVLASILAGAQTRFAEAEDALFAQTNVAATAMLAAIGVAIVVGLGFAFATARTISRPLSEVTRTAGIIASGDLNQRVIIDSRDEIGLLADNFNAMTDTLQEIVETEQARKEVLERMVSDYLRFVERVTSGDLSARLSTGEDGGVQADFDDELIRLAENLNVMAANLDEMVRQESKARRSMEITVAEYRKFVQQIAAGDLTNRLELGVETADDEIDSDDLYNLGANLNAMVESLADMARQVREAATSISAAATEIQAATTQQLASATEQDVTVTETVATVEEVRTTVIQTAERAQAVTESSQQSVEVSRAGQEIVADSMEGMATIRQQVENIAETILMLSERTQQIGEIIDTVNALADQSKLLALNASIEAARAGEQGKGFAVVAMEVRQLAEQSREATERVRDILSEIQQATNTAVMVTEKGSKGVEAGMGLVQRAGETIYALGETLEEVAQASMQNAASTQQQTNGMDQLAAAMAQIKQASTQTAASTRQAEQSVRDLTETARQLEEAAARYQL